MICEGCMSKRAVMQQAIEALDLGVVYGHNGLYRDELRQMKDAIIALRQALAEPEHPVQHGCRMVLGVLRCGGDRSKER